MTILGATLSEFDEDNRIPSYGFGCSRTHDNAVFSLRPRDEACYGFEDVLACYRACAPPVTALAGPTSFAPLIRHAMSIVAREGQYHVLLIVADGQVTRPSDLPANQLSEQEAETISAIVDASKLPLSIVMIGVGAWPPGAALWGERGRGAAAARELALTPQIISPLIPPPPPVPLRRRPVCHHGEL